MFPAVQHDEQAAAANVAKWFPGVAVPPRDPEPEHIHWGAEFVALQCGPGPECRMPAVARDDQSRPNIEVALRASRSHANDLPSFLDEVRSFRLHAQIERPVAAALPGEQVEEVPLRHERHALAAGRHMAKVDDPDTLVADLENQALQLAVRQ